MHSRQEVDPRYVGYSAEDLRRIAADHSIAALDYHDQLDSTSDRALELARRDATRTPLVVLARAQTAGRGRRGRRWFSAPGALTFSLILDAPRGPAADRGATVSLLAALAVRDALAAMLPEQRLQLKWPNDVLLGGRKVCGILVETPATPAMRHVFGIGINVNNFVHDDAKIQSPSGVDEAPLFRATSLCEATGRPAPLAETLLSVTRMLVRRVFVDRPADWSLREAWRGHCAATDRVVDVATGATTTTGRCLGIAEDGALLVSTPQGVCSIHEGRVVGIA